MRIQRFATALLVLAFTAGCASAPPKAVRSEFEDIPVPKGLSYQPDKSTIIESPTVKAARLVYRGRLEVDSLATAMRTTLEANGWRHVSSTSVSDHGVTQIYEKASSSLEVRLVDGWWYTVVELTASRATQHAITTTPR
jgi:hypothetical protein